MSGASWPCSCAQCCPVGASCGRCEAASGTVCKPKCSDHPAENPLCEFMTGWMRTGLPELMASLAAERSENERLRGRQQELLALIAKLARETPYPAELDECRSARAALIAEVGTLRAKVSELENALAADRLHETPEQFAARFGVKP